MANDIKQLTEAYDSMYPPARWREDENFPQTIIDSNGNYVGRVNDATDRANIIAAHNATLQPDDGGEPEMEVGENPRSEYGPVGDSYGVG